MSYNMTKYNSIYKYAIMNFEYTPLGIEIVHKNKERT